MSNRERRLEVSYMAVEQSFALWLVTCPGYVSQAAGKIARRTATDEERRFVAQYLAEKLKVSRWEVVRPPSMHPAGGDVALE